MKQPSDETMKRTSRWFIWLYAAAAALNVVVFLTGAHHEDNLAIAVLFGVLIGNQKTVDAWRESAHAWRESAQRWRENAESYRRW